MIFDASLPNVEVLTHSSIRIVAHDGTIFHFDPFEMTSSPADADVVFVTHSHFDHLSPADLRRAAKPNATLVVPASVAKQASGLTTGEVVCMNAGDKCEVKGFPVEAVGAYNVVKSRLSCHPKANGWLGYVVTIDDVRYYVAGDTDQNSDNSKVVCDVALVPAGGTYTMDAHEAAAFVNHLRPKVAVPTHYGTLAGAPGDGKAFAALVDPQITVTLKLG